MKFLPPPLLEPSGADSVAITQLSITSALSLRSPSYQFHWWVRRTDPRMRSSGPLEVPPGPCTSSPAGKGIHRFPSKRRVCTVQLANGPCPSPFNKPQCFASLGSAFPTVPVLHPRRTTAFRKGTANWPRIPNLPLRFARGISDVHASSGLDGGACCSVQLAAHLVRLGLGWGFVPDKSRHRAAG